MPKPIVLHLGDAIKYNQQFYNTSFLDRFNVVRNDKLDRESFMKALKTREFGDFSAVLRPHFQSGIEMGRWDDELISLLPPSLHIVASAGAGFDWVDVDALGKHKIWYANGAGCSDEAVSDTALYFVLSTFRNFTRSQLAARTADVDKFKQAHQLIATISRNPSGHILGIVGLGSIGKQLARKVQVLGMDVHYFDTIRLNPDEELRLKLTYHSTLEDLLKISDCVSLHTPLNQHTKNLINKDTIAMMKPGARLINTARGQVVEESALIEALKSGKLSAAALDVHYNEPQVSPELAAMENVTLTTHVGGGALETRMGFELNAMKNILAVVGSNGEVMGEPLTPVNRKTYEAA